MWPKMLFEILPHIGRLVPMAEKFLETRGARDAEEQASLNAIAETLRIELGRAAEENAAIQQVLMAQGQQAAATAVEVSRMRQGLDLLESRLGRLEAGSAQAFEAAERAERSADRASKLFIVVVVLLVAVVAMLTFLIFRVQGH